MSKTEQFKILMEGAKIWNDWRNLYPETAIDLSEADLRMETVKGANLSKVNLSKADLRRASAIEADFAQANLKGANLNRSIATKANFSGADLGGANLSQSNMSGANFSGAKLKSANFKNTLLTKATGLTQAQIDESIGNHSTGLPEGLQHPANWEQGDKE